MKLFYIANIRMPTERAHGIQVAKMCEAFARQGAEVTLLVPDRKTFDADPFSYYAVERNFSIEKIPVPDSVGLGKVGFLIESLVFAWRAARRVLSYSSFSKGGGQRPEDFKNPSTHQNVVLPLKKGESDIIVYTREELPLLLLPKGTRAFYEMHQLRGSFLQQFVKKALGIIAITGGLKRALSARGYPSKQILVAHDAVDLEQFNIPVSKEEARKHLGLPLEDKIALYIGGFEAWKGLKTVLQASKTLQERGIRTVVVGGTPKEIVGLQKQYRETTFLGYRPYAELPLIQRAADVLLVPNSGKERISREFTSPLKLFAHMASGVPIVASDLPSLREVLSEREAIFFTPDDPQSSVSAVMQALAPEAVVRAEAATSKVRECTWDKRAQRILEFVKIP
ncbi:MAG: glycosyltransferase [bacterium]|nr:glycosyltransferase [bacterium]